MKILCKIGVLLLAALAFSCSRNVEINEAVNSSLFKYPESFRKQLFTPRTEKPLIEVNTKLGGMYWLHGDFLEFRIYPDGMVEFDDCAPQGRALGMLGENKTEDFCVGKQTKIAEGELNLLIELLQTKEFGALESQYLKTGPTCDAVPSVRLTAKSKHIKISWCDSLSNPMTSPEFPQVLSVLFRHFEDIKSGKYIDPSTVN